MPALHRESRYDPMATRDGDEKGYPWFFLYIKRPWVFRLLITLVIILVSYTIYQLYSRYGDDPTPDSVAGYLFAIAGTTCFVLAGVLYSLRRRARKRAIGKLNTALNWHMFFAVMGVAFLFMHSFGNFNPRSGTYALYGMIALAVSGFIGRALDRIMPRLIAAEVNKALTAQGEDRIETISHKLQTIITHNTEQLHGFAAPGTSPTSGALPTASQQNPNRLPFASNAQTLHSPWDLAYISLDETPQELRRGETSYRFVPDRKSAFSRPGALMPGAQEQIAALANVQKALQREQFYRYVIRYWRLFHYALILLTIGLIIWHLVYAAQLLIPVYFH